MLHSEEWVSLGGPIRAKVDKDAGRIMLENQSKVDLRDVAILGTPDRNSRQLAWVGDLFSGQKKEIELQTGGGIESWFAQWDERDITRRYETVLSVDGRQSLVGQQEGVLSVGQMMDSAIRSIEFRPGRYVAVGRIDQELGDLNIYPKASQQNRNGMFVLHLASGQLGTLGPDQSLPPKITELDEAPSQISDDTTN